MSFEEERHAFSLAWDFFTIHAKFIFGLCAYGWNPKSNSGVYTLISGRVISGTFLEVFVMSTCIYSVVRSDELNNQESYQSIYLFSWT